MGAAVLRAGSSQPALSASCHGLLGSPRSKCFLGWAVLVPAVAACVWGGDGRLPSPASPCSGAVNPTRTR